MEKVFDIGFLQNDLLHWFYFAGFFAGGVLCSCFVRVIMSAIIKAHCGKTKTTLDDEIFSKLKTPVSLIFVLVGIHLGFKHLYFNDLVELWKDRIVTILYSILIGSSVMNVLDIIIIHFIPMENDRINKNIKEFAGTELQPVLRRIIKWILWTIIGVFTIKTLGYDINAILAGLGIGGAALALASKDTLANFFGSISVFVDKPFRINDRIKVAGFDGYITEMRLRTSRLKTTDNRIVTIPNSIFSATPIENVSSEPNTRVVQTISIRSENGAEKAALAVQILNNITVDNGRLSSPCKASLSYIGVVVFRITFIFFISRGADYWGTINDINTEVLRQFEKSGIKM